MSVLLEDVKKVAEMKPVVWVNLGGMWQKRRLHLFASVVSSDQKSQDYLCGRMAINNGSARCVHRGCMASGVNATAVGLDGVVHGGCQKLLPRVLGRLNDLAPMEVSNGAKSGPMALMGQLLPGASSKEQKDKGLVVDNLCRIQ
jgi:hypothetical protein